MDEAITLVPRPQSEQDARCAANLRRIRDELVASVTIARGTGLEVLLDFEHAEDGELQIFIDVRRPF